MVLWKKLWLGGLGLVGLVTGLALRLSAARWKRRSLQMVEQIMGQPVLASEAKTVTFQDFAALPSPMARYLRRTLREGQPLIRAVRITQAGSLRGLEKLHDQWMPFTAVQSFAALRPGFVWEARVRASSWLSLQVRDSYVNSRGEAQVSAFSRVTLAEDHDKPELASGALLRYLAEAVWFPTALLPSARLTWTPIDERAALATLTDGETTVALEFRFNDRDEIISFYSPDRYFAVGGGYELRPWEGQLRAYEERQGLWIPTEGEVAWHLPEGIVPVWKGKILETDYDYAE